VTQSESVTDLCHTTNSVPHWATVAYGMGHVVVPYTTVARLA